MNRSYPLIAAGLLALTGLVSAKPLTQIVDDQTELLLIVDNLQELRQVWLEHPLAAALTDPAWPSRFNGWMGQDPDSSGGFPDAATKVLQEEFNLSWEELFTLFPGQLSISLHNFAELITQQTGQMDLSVLVEFSGTAEQLRALMQIQFERNAAAQQAENPLIQHELLEEVFMGETLYIDEVFDGADSYVEDGFALVDGVFILAVKPERLRSMVEAIKSGTERPLGRSAAFTRLREQSPGQDVFLYANLEAMGPRIGSALRDPKVTAPFAMFGVTGPGLERALALEALQAAAVDLKLTATGFNSSSGLLFGPKAGLLRLATYGRGGVPAASYVPERPMTASATSFDLSQMFKELQALMAAISPTSPMLLEIQLQQMRQQTGVDLRSALLENFGPELVTFSVLPENEPGEGDILQPEQVYVVAIKDAASLSNALEALKDRIPGVRGQFETLAFKGETIHTLRNNAATGGPGMGPMGISYAITRSHLLVHVGAGNRLQEVISAMQEGRGALWQQPVVLEGFERIARPGAVTRSYVDLNQMAGVTIGNFSKMVRMGAGQGASGSPVPPALSLPFLILTEMNESDDGLFSRSILLPFENAK